MSSQLLIAGHNSFASGDLLKKTSPTLASLRILLTFSTSSFNVFDFKLKSLIYLDIILMYNK